MKTMTCKCGQEIQYNNHYHCYECECGKTFNGVGQELAPRSEWQEEYDNEDYWVEKEIV